MDQSQVDKLLRQGIAAARAGETEQAQQALMQVVEGDETNVQAWLWLSSVVVDPVDRFTCLHNVLQLDPDNQPAQLGLARLNQTDLSVQAPLELEGTNSAEGEAAEPAASSSPHVDSSTPKPARRTSRYKRLTPKPKSEPQSEPIAKSSRREKSKKSEASDNLRYKRSAADTGESVPGEAPQHREAYASVASALIQQKAGRFGGQAGHTDTETRQGSAVCPFCRARISVMATACDVCQLPLVVDCPNCEARIDVELPACPSCKREMGNYRNKSVYFANLAAAYQQRSKNHLAMTTWEIVRSIDPTYPNLYVQLAKAQAGADKPNKAVQTLKLVLEAEPGQEAASLALGEIYHNLSYWDEAEEIYREALAVSPESAEVHYAFGWMLVDYGQTQSGLEYIQRSTKLNPQHGMAWYRLGQVYDLLHRPKKAGRAYRRAVKLLPQGSLAHKKAAHQTSVLEPELPQVLSTGWAEFFRQSAGPFMVCVVAALLDAGLRPWWIPLPGWLALAVGFIGVVLWVSGISLPQNPVICLLVGKRGLTDSGSRLFAIVIGAFFWLLAMSIILYPLNQSPPEVPEWILNS